jgi:hypothetical protein
VARDAERSVFAEEKRLLGQALSAALQQRDVFAAELPVLRAQLARETELSGDLSGVVVAARETAAALVLADAEVRRFTLALSATRDQRDARAVADSLTPAQRSTHLLVRGPPGVAGDAPQRLRMGSNACVCCGMLIGICHGALSTLSTVNRVKLQMTSSSSNLTGAICFQVLGMMQDRARMGRAVHEAEARAAAAEQATEKVLTERRSLSGELAQLTTTINKLERERRLAEDHGGAAQQTSAAAAREVATLQARTLGMMRAACTGFDGEAGYLSTPPGRALDTCAGSAYHICYIAPLATWEDAVDLFDANRTNRIRGGRRAHAAVSPRPPNSSNALVVRTEGSTYAAKVRFASIVRGPFSVAPCQTLSVQFATNKPLCGRANAPTRYGALLGVCAGACGLH